MSISRFPDSARYRLALAVFFAFAMAAFAAAQTPEEISEAKERFPSLYEKGNLVEALPYAEILAKANPDDPEVHVKYGFCLLGKSTVAPTQVEKAQLIIDARQQFVRAKQLGSRENLVDAMIASLPKDGTSGNFSPIKAAEVFMKTGEAAYSSGRMDDALDAYQAALQLDPNLYEAPLFCGDACTQKGDYKNAEIWYQKAIAIDPYRETAYRYSATPLMKQKKHKEALDRYIEAFVVEPYSKFAVNGLIQWGAATKTRLGHPQIDPPKTTVGEDGKLKTEININPLVDDGSMAWIGYTAVRTEWRESKFKQRFPGEGTYRHSLEEEAEALRSVIKLAKELTDKKTKLNPQLATMIELDKKGLLESFILLAIPDNGIALDHADYLKKNRGKLKQYVREYVVHD